MKTYKECFDEGKVRKSSEYISWVSKELLVAKNNIKSAENIFKINEYEAVLISAYNAVLHLNKALIYSKGFSVKGHLCIIKTVEELFKDNKEIIEFISSIERSLESRNLIQYEGYSIDKDAAKFMLDLAKDYFELVKKLLGL
jgi:uncharacterized protein (UPF0332 family)